MITEQRTFKITTGEDCDDEMAWQYDPDPLTVFVTIDLHTGLVVHWNAWDAGSRNVAYSTDADWIPLPINEPQAFEKAIKSAWRVAHPTTKV